MKRLHVNIAVRDLERTTKFYSNLFAAEPTVKKDDYAKWMLDDPLVNFSVTTRGEVSGVNHLGIEVDNEADLAPLRERLTLAGDDIVDQPDINCCYARSTKAWIRDPDGIAWETFFSRAATTDYGEGSAVSEAQPLRRPGETGSQRCC